MKRALILGGSGFVGRYLADELLSAGYTVALTGSSRPPEMPGCEGFVLDILNAEAVSALLESWQPDALFHLAAQSSAALSWKKPALTVDVNVKGTVNVMEAMAAAEKKPRLLLVGSSEEYGTVREEDCPLPESQPLRPGNVYAATKVTQELLLPLYTAAYGLEIVATRSFNHVGPGQLPDFVISDFCRQTALIERGGRESVIRVGNLSARRDFTDVRDVVRAYRLLMERGESGEVYNVGSGCAVAVEEVLRRILALSSREIRVEIDESRFRPLDAPLNVADIAKIRAAVGWEPVIPLDETLRDTLNYWRNS